MLDSQTRRHLQRIIVRLNEHDIMIKKILDAIELKADSIIPPTIQKKSKKNKE